MNGKEYLHTQFLLIEIGKASSKLDLDGFLRSISNAETVAPIIDPTLYKKAAANLGAIKKLAQAVQSVQEAHHEMVAAVVKTEVEKQQ